MYMFVSLLRVKNYGKDTQFEMRKTAKFVWYNLLVFGQISWFFTRDLLVFQILEWHVWLMGECKKDVAPLLTHWSYVFFALNHGYSVHYVVNAFDLLKSLMAAWEPELAIDGSTPNEYGVIIVLH